jgi:hypothetical protein
MEMIPHQAVGKGVAYWQNVLLIQLHEIAIVPLFNEDILPVVAPIEDMVIMSRLKRDIGSHRFILTLRRQTSEVFKTSEV